MFQQDSKKTHLLAMQIVSTNYKHQFPSSCKISAYYLYMTSIEFQTWRSRENFTNSAYSRHWRHGGNFLGYNFWKKKAFCLLAPTKQKIFLTISNENIFSKTQGTRLGVKVAPNKATELVLTNRYGETFWTRILCFEYYNELKLYDHRNVYMHFHIFSEHNVSR